MQKLYDIEVNQTLTIVEDLSLNIFTSQNPESTIAPNPTSNVFYINGIDGNSQINLRDLSGKNIGQFRYENGINIAHLPSGIYVVEYFFEGIAQTRKIVKE